MRTGLKEEADEMYRMKSVMNALYFSEKLFNWIGQCITHSPVNATMKDQDATDEIFGEAESAGFHLR